jgi:glucan phosphoethanolaminetransferase (alkaline phosphatase superfamily)
MEEKQEKTIVIIAVVMLVLLLYWAWLTSFELFVFGLIVAIMNFYIFFAVAISLKILKHIMQEEKQLEK